MATPEQIKKIHTLKTKYDISDNLYREIIATRFCGIESSKDLNEDEASELIQVLITLTGDNYDEQENAPEQFIDANAEEKYNIGGEKLKKVIYDLCEMLPKKEILKVFLNKTTIEQNKHIIKELINKVGAENE